MDTRFQRGWRPLFGYVVAASWALQSLAVSFVVVARPDQAAPLLNGLAELTAQWGFALGVTGLAVHARSRDKAARPGYTMGHGTGDLHPDARG
jgi:hypothetical protein